MRKVLFLVSAILLFSCVTVYGFTDVDESSEYYEAVNYMYENGIVGGYGDDTFRPDNPISYNELAVILTRSSDIYEKYLTVFDLPHPHWATSYLIFVRTQGWFNVSEMYYGNAGECNNLVSKSMALRGIFGMFGLELYNYHFYEKEIADIEECQSENAQNAVMLAYVLGFIDVDENNKLGVNDNITRGEVCKLIYDLYKLKETGGINVIVPQIVEDLDIVFIEPVSEKGELQVINELAWFPMDIIKEFNDRNWTLYITNSNLFEVYKGPYFSELNSAVGLCDYNRKEIWVNYTLLININSTLMHEFGHFVKHTYFDTVSDETIIYRLYTEEKKQLTELCGRDYCETNSSEFFAEAFKKYTAYVYSLGLEDKEENYKNLAPKTYDFFTKFFMEIDKGFKHKREQKAISEEEITNEFKEVTEEKSNETIQ